MPCLRLAGSSPHTRGALQLAVPVDDGRRIIPAYAGSTSPHTRATRGPTGSSPHTRGAPTPPFTSRASTRIIPAYAGSTLGCSPASIGNPDHPRIRGEHLIDGIGGFPLAGSSPHTRGAPPLSQQSTRPIRIIPAYAGSTHAVLSKFTAVQDHPRIRGEHFERHLQWGVAFRIIPAYAGSTLSDQLNLEVHVLISISSYNFRRPAGASYCLGLNFLRGFRRFHTVCEPVSPPPDCSVGFSAAARRGISIGT